MDDLTRAKLIYLGLIHPRDRELPSQLSRLNAIKLERLLRNGNVEIHLSMVLPESLLPYVSGAGEAILGDYLSLNGKITARDGH